MAYVGHSAALTPTTAAAASVSPVTDFVYNNPCNKRKDNYRNYYRCNHIDTSAFYILRVFVLVM